MAAAASIPQVEDPSASLVTQRFIAVSQQHFWHACWMRMQCIQCDIVCSSCRVHSQPVPSPFLTSLILQFVKDFEIRGTESQPMSTSQVGEKVSAEEWEEGQGMPGRVASASPLPLPLSALALLPLLQEYLHQINIMKELATTTMFVDFQHVISYDQVLANAISRFYYRFEAAIRRGLRAAVAELDADYLTEQGEEKEFFVSFYNTGAPVK